LLAADLLQLRQTSFALWNPRGGANAPVLVIGVFQPGNPNTLSNPRNIPLLTSGKLGLWTIAAMNCGLADGTLPLLVFRREYRAADHENDLSRTMLVQF
jgi:hypothetical protein